MSHMRTRLIRLGAVAVASATGLGLAAGTAGDIAGAAATTASGGSGSSTTPATLSGIQAKASSDITQRVNALNAAIAKVNAAKGLGSSQATLASYLGADIAPLQQLNTKIQGDTTVQQAVQDFATIFSGYRVYLLVLPSARIAGDADRITSSVLPRLTSDASKAQAHENANNQAQLQPLITDLNAQISAATSATNGLAGTVLGYTPAEWNGNHELLSPAKSDDQTAAAAIKKGRQDVVQIVQILRPGLAGGAKSAGGAATTTTTS
jgi:hypothetical protein